MSRHLMTAHLYEALADGSLHYGSVSDGIAFPREALSGTGLIDGRPVRCEAPEWVVRWHTGYPPRLVDRHDVLLLCDRFGIERPAGF
jgi:lincosamide nucleotidyltransferase A/C/D/E